MKLWVIEAVMAEASRATDIPLDILRTRTRIQPVVDTRQAIMLVLRRRTTLSSPQIARALGLGDHTTVLHGIRKASERAERDVAYAALIARLMAVEPRSDNTPFALPAPLSRQEISDLARKRENQRESEKRRKRREMAKGPVTRPKPKKLRKLPMKVIVSKQPGAERIEMNEDRAFMVDRHGYCQGEHDLRHNMIIGSIALADAIAAARSAAA